MSARQDHSSADFAKSRKQIFIVDDHPLVRSTLVALIEEQLDMGVCGQAAAVPDALKSVGELRPDLVITDISMPGASGLELIAELKRSFPQILVLAISAYEEALYEERVMHAGARGYVSKREGMSTILRAIRSVLAGQLYFSPRILERLCETVASGSTTPHGLNLLSARELQVLELVGEGKNSHAIATALQISVKTVDVHRQNLKEKLKFESGMELTCYAVRWVHSRSRGRQAGFDKSL